MTHILQMTNQVTGALSGHVWTTAKSLSVLSINQRSVQSNIFSSLLKALFCSNNSPLGCVFAAFRSLCTELKTGRDTFIAGLGYKKE